MQHPLECGGVLEDPDRYDELAAVPRDQLHVVLHLVLVPPVLLLRECLLLSWLSSGNRGHHRHQVGYDGFFLCGGGQEQRRYGRGGADEGVVGARATLGVPLLIRDHHVLAVLNCELEEPLIQRFDRL